MSSDEDPSGAPPVDTGRAAYRLGPLRIEPDLNRVVDEAGEARRLEPASMDVQVRGGFLPWYQRALASIGRGGRRRRRSIGCSSSPTRR